MIEVIIDGIFAMLAAVGTVTLVWMVAGIAIRPKECSGVKTYIVICAEAYERNIDSVLDFLRWKENMLCDDSDIIICGDEDAKFPREKVGRFRNRIVCMTPEEICRHLRKSIGCFSERDMNETGNFRHRGDC